MKIEDFMIRIIDCYVNNDIQYLEEQIELGKNKYHIDTTADEEDLQFLEKLNWEDYCNIFKKIEETELMSNIYETIHEYLYDYKNEKKEV